MLRYEIETEWVTFKSWMIGRFLSWHQECELVTKKLEQYYILNIRMQRLQTKDIFILQINSDTSHIIVDWFYFKTDELHYSGILVM